MPLLNVADFNDVFWTSTPPKLWTLPGIMIDSRPVLLDKALVPVRVVILLGKNNDFNFSEACMP